MDQFLILGIIMCTAFIKNEAIPRPVYKIVLNQTYQTQYLEYNIASLPIQEFTFCVWLRFFNLNYEQPLFSYRGGTEPSVRTRILLTNGGKLMKISIDGRSASVITVDIKERIWEHYCISYQSEQGAWALYLNSRLVSCVASENLVGAVLPRDGILTIGIDVDESDLVHRLNAEIFGVNMILVSTIQKKKIKKTLAKKPVISVDVEQQLLLGTDIKNITTEFPVNNDINNFIETDDGLDRNLLSLLKERAPSPTSQDFWNNMDNIELFGSGTQEFPIVSVMLTPPPPSLTNFEIFNNNSENRNLNIAFPDSNNMPLTQQNKTSHELLDMEVPPPLNRNNKLNADWSSYRFASEVLNHIKKMTYPKRIPQYGPPSMKLSEPHPYSTEIITSNILYPYFRSQIDKMNNKIKREVHAPHINVQILEESFRDNVIKTHSESKPINVEITNRGEPNNKNNIYYGYGTHYSYQLTPRPFQITKEKSEELVKTNEKKKSLSITNNGDSDDIIENAETKHPRDMYLKVLSNSEQWHNVKNYKDTYSPRRIKINMMEENIMPKTQNNDFSQNQFKIKDIINVLLDKYITKDFTKDVLEHLYQKLDISTKKDEEKRSNLKENILKSTEIKSRREKKNNFHKSIKIGNALNERQVIGIKDDEKKTSFVQGNENIPDVNPYRSDIDKEGSRNVPPSLARKICFDVDIYKSVLFINVNNNVDDDGLVPDKRKNLAFDFILANYKKCTLRGTVHDKSPLVYIDWGRSPVKVFGGAYPQEEKNVCHKIAA